MGWISYALIAQLVAETSVHKASFSLENPCRPEFDRDESTRWLPALSKGQFDDVEDANLVAQLKSSPRALADVSDEVAELGGSGMTEGEGG